MTSGQAPGRWSRLAVVGASGTGKTQLTTALAQACGVPCVSLDDLRWPASGTASDEEFAHRLAESTAGPCWAVEGAETSPAVRAAWRRAELVVWLDHSRAGVGVRMLVGTSWLGGPGSDVAQGRLAYVGYLVRKARRSRQQAARLRRTLPAVLEGLEADGVQVVRLRSVRATRHWLRAVQGQRPRPSE